jgi:hypothetical protein
MFGEGLTQIRKMFIHGGLIELEPDQEMLAGELIILWLMMILLIM